MRCATTFLLAFCALLVAMFSTHAQLGNTQKASCACVGF